MTEEHRKTGLRSMTGFASTEGNFADWRWTGELRSVNGKGLDLRVRLPDWIDGLEQACRVALGKKLDRGSISLSLRVSRDDSSGTLALNTGQLDNILRACVDIEERAKQVGLALAPSRAADIAMARGVLEQGQSDPEDTGKLKAAILTSVDAMLDAMCEMRQVEGAALNNLLNEHLEVLANLVQNASDLLEQRKDQSREQLQRNLAKVLDDTSGMDPDRLAQELALIAVKADVTEELDRLRAHIDAARNLIGQGGTVGRKLDFLMQEFNREANTLCSKSQNVELTRIGLDLKAVIDQMREQVQNVE